MRRTGVADFTAHTAVEVLRRVAARAYLCQRSSSKVKAYNPLAISSRLILNSFVTKCVEYARHTHPAVQRAIYRSRVSFSARQRYPAAVIRVLTVFSRRPALFVRDRISLRAGSVRQFVSRAQFFHRLATRYPFVATAATTLKKHSLLGSRYFVARTRCLSPLLAGRPEKSIFLQTPVALNRNKRRARAASRSARRARKA